jgi:hypothetical protein
MARPSSKVGPNVHKDYKYSTATHLYSSLCAYACIQYSAAALQTYGPGPGTCRAVTSCPSHLGTPT